MRVARGWVARLRMFERRGDRAKGGLGCCKGTRQADSVSGDIMLDHRKKRVKRAAKDRDTAHFRHMTLAYTPKHCS